MLYADNTFAATNLALANGNNTFTAIGRDASGHVATNKVNVSVSANAFVYDLNGNLLNDGQRYFTYDDENELTSVTVSNAWQSVYVYDGKLRRRIDREYTWNSGAWQLAAETYYVYDGNVVLQERWGGNIPAVTYTRGNDLSGSLQGAGGIGGLLARTDFNGSAYYHADGNGNVTMLLDANQNVAAKYLYDPYGNTLAMSGQLASANVYRFSSKEWNANAGLYYYLYRFYDPYLQRWPNRDPLGERGFEILRAATQTSVASTPLLQSGRWINRYPPLHQKPAERREGANLYRAFKNSPLDNFDALGLGANCGSGLTSGLVPDKPAGYDFSTACQTHDKCYDTCGASQNDCDEKFLEDMQSICESRYSSAVGCNDLANIYYGAVQNYAQGAFADAQKAACDKNKCKK